MVRQTPSPKSIAAYLVIGILLSSQNTMSKSFKDTLKHTFQSLYARFEPDKKMITEGYDFDQKGNLELKNPNGHVKVIGWDEPKIEVVATCHGSEKDVEDMHVEIDAGEEDGSRKSCDIKTDYSSKKMKGSVDYSIKLPKDASMDLDVTNGNIEVDGIFGAVIAKTGKGNITVTNANGDLDVDAKSGHLKVHYSDLPDHTTTTMKSGNTTTLTLPENACSKLEAETSKGLITSTIPIKLAPVEMKLDSNSWIKHKRDIKGTIGSERKKSTIGIKSYGTIRIVHPKPLTKGK